MLKIKQSIRVGVPAHRVFDYLTRPAYLPEIWPSLVEVSNVNREPNATYRFDWIHKLGGVRFKGHTEATHVERERRLVWKTERGLPSIVTWTFTPDGGGTRVDFEMDYVIPIPLAEQLGSEFVHGSNEHETRTLLENLKTRMETAAHHEATRRHSAA